MGGLSYDLRHPSEKGFFEHRQPEDQRTQPRVPKPEGKAGRLTYYRRRKVEASWKASVSKAPPF
jgi:hypothetical protein